MSKRKKHKTTKNTMPKPPVTRLLNIGVECNGRFNLITDFKNQNEFDVIFKEWFEHPNTKRWCAESFIDYVKTKQPKRICLLEEDYYATIKGKGVIPATKEEYEAENN